jgi:two-component system, NtrC family, sensor kinase
LELLHQIPEIEIVGIADKDPAAFGLKRARDLNVPVTDQVRDLVENHGVNLIMDVTGDPAMGPLIHAMKRPGSEVLSGAATRLLWNLVQHQSKLEAELFQADKLAGLGSFAAGIAHDMNNPLQLILGLAENLAEEQNLNEVHEQAREIIEAVKRTSAICRDLTSYARRNGAGEESFVNLNLKMDEALKIARYAVTLQDITVIKDYAEDATVIGNPDELLHVFVNLITNAVQAITDRGTLTLRTAVEPDGKIVASVSDTGCGIPKEAFSKIFEPLYTTKPPGKGTGLGLYNVMSVISKMEGHICVESDVGVGTTFRIEFPQIQPTMPGAPL